jgi:hypothetical protein
MCLALNPFAKHFVLTGMRQIARGVRSDGGMVIRLQLIQNGVGRSVLRHGASFVWSLLFSKNKCAHCVGQNKCDIVLAILTNHKAGNKADDRARIQLASK